jgi:hypothetical protein
VKSFATLSAAERALYWRNYADLAALWQHPGGRAAAARPDLLERVRIHKSRFFASSRARYDIAVPGTLRIVPPDARLPISIPSSRRCARRRTPSMRPSMQSDRIKSWPAHERPREKLLAHGAESLNPDELLAVVLRVGQVLTARIRSGGRGYSCRRSW